MKKSRHGYMACYAYRSTSMLLDIGVRPCLIELMVQDGDSHLVKWNETEGAIKRTYNSFRKRSLGVVQFDITRNHFLAAGDEFVVKFWDMGNTCITNNNRL